MNERQICHGLDQVKAGRLSRRAFIEVMAGLGISAPLVGAMLTSAGVSAAAPASVFTPTKRGGGGSLRVLMWQAPTLLNPRLAVGTKDWDAARMFYEPLASFDADGNLVPVLAEEAPSFANGGLARDGRSVTWRLKRGVTWHDGRPFTADDVVFNWQYVMDPATGSPGVVGFQPMARVDAPDNLTVRITFKQPTPFWTAAFCGVSMLIPRHVFAPYIGARSREAPANLRPVGTGPFRCMDFKPGDLIKAEINPDYHVANRPFFDTIEVKGGGDAVSAARAVLQTGAYDYAPYMAGVEDTILERLERVGKGRLDVTFGGDLTHIQVNQTDPWTEVDGERSSAKTQHPFLTDPAVRTALSLLVDRAGIQEQVFGRTGTATANWLNAPSQFESKNTRREFSLEKANQVLESAGWRRGSDAVRQRNGIKLKLVFQTAINSLAQKIQAIVKQTAARAGVEMELKAVPASTFGGSDPANRDGYTHFSADLQLITYFQSAPDPERFMSLFTSDEIPSRENKWQRYNAPRWRNRTYDDLFAAARTEMDPVKRAALFIRMNDLLIQGGAIIPLARRATVNARAVAIRDAEHTAWDRAFWRLAYWYREA
jgi:peptide/nickel transport system substrate-binding protein